MGFKIPSGLHIWVPHSSSYVSNQTEQARLLAHPLIHLWTNHNLLSIPTLAIPFPFRITWFIPTSNPGLTFSWRPSSSSCSTDSRRPFPPETPHPSTSVPFGIPWTFH